MLKPVNLLAINLEITAIMCLRFDKYPLEVQFCLLSYSLYARPLNAIQFDCNKN